MKPIVSFATALAVSATVTGGVALSALGLSRSSVAAQPARTVRRVDVSQLRAGEICGTVAPPLERRQIIERELATGDTRRSISESASKPASEAVSITPRPIAAPIARSVVVPVYMHILQSENGEGNVTDARIGEMIDILNKGYAGKMTRQSGSLASEQATAGTRYSFRLAGVDRIRDTEEQKWFDWTLLETDEGLVKGSTRRGGANALNIWTANLGIYEVGDGLIGYAQFPWDYATNPTTDGVVLYYPSVPGGFISDQYKNVVIHEVGHWLGLYHTFQGGCTELNDGVSDTPAQDPDFGFPDPFGFALPDTCSGRRFPGRDASLNFMNYTTANYLYQFTPQQAQRMSTAGSQYRRL